MANPPPPFRELDFTCVIDQHIHIAKGGGSGAHLVSDTDIHLKGRDLDLRMFLEQILFQDLETIFTAGGQKLIYKYIAGKKLG